MHSFFGAHLACSARSVSAVACPAGFKNHPPLQARCTSTSYQIGQLVYWSGKFSLAK